MQYGTINDRNVWDNHVQIIAQEIHLYNVHVSSLTQDNLTRFIVMAKCIDMDFNGHNGDSWIMILK